jgi:hypothetical protein
VKLTKAHAHALTASTVAGLRCGRDLKSVTDREVCCYAVSCKNQTNFGVCVWGGGGNVYVWG